MHLANAINVRIIQLIESTNARENEMNALDQFKADLKNAADDKDKKESVQRLANRIGVEFANEIAAEHGLWSAYYRAI